MLPARRLSSLVPAQRQHRSECQERKHQPPWRREERPVSGTLREANARGDQPGEHDVWRCVPRGGSANAMLVTKTFRSSEILPDEDYV